MNDCKSYIYSLLHIIITLQKFLVKYEKTVRSRLDAKRKKKRRLWIQIRISYFASLYTGNDFEKFQSELRRSISLIKIR